MATYKKPLAQAILSDYYYAPFGETWTFVKAVEKGIVNHLHHLYRLLKKHEILFSLPFCTHRHEEF